MKIFSLVIVFLFFGIYAWGYPEFIGYGYSTCITCHYNGQGGGPLNDYGRALLSAEISSRLFYPKSKTDEQIADESGFLGSVPLPYWLRPHAKYRGLELEQNPGGPSPGWKYFHMQADIGTTVQNEDGRYLASVTVGRVVRPQDYATGREGLDVFRATDYYGRIQIGETWWVYAGLMEKVYGIRNIDHTSFQRTYQGFNQVNDNLDGIESSEGIIVHKIEKKWEVAGNVFIGNPYDDTAYRQSGFSAMGEYEVADRKRLGASISIAKSNLLKKNMVGIHYRQGLSKGSAVILEGGLINNRPSGADQATGGYGLVQGLIALTRGYNIKTTIEHYNSQFRITQPDIWRYSAGFLIFPFPRLELRAEVLNQRQLSSQTSQNDYWAFLGQVHVSL